MPGTAVRTPELLNEMQQASIGAVRTISVEDLAKLRVRAPKARKRDLTNPTSRQNEPTWVGRLSLMRPPGFDSSGSDRMFPDQRQVCYAVLPTLSTRQNGLVVDLRQRT